MRRSTYSSLFSYPPENVYPIKKPGDVPKITPGDHSTYRYCTYSSSGGDTVLKQLLLYDSTFMLKAPCAERWTSAPVRTCLHATAPLTVPTAPPTLRRLSSPLCYTRSEATPPCAYSGRLQGSHSSHVVYSSRLCFFCALRVTTPPTQPSPSRTSTPRFTSDTSRAGGGDISN